MKAHVGVDTAAGLVHTVVTTSGNISDINVAGALLHGDEEVAFGDAGYQGVHRHPEAAMQRGACARLRQPRTSSFGQPICRRERLLGGGSSSSRRPRPVIRGQAAAAPPASTRYRG